ncbi:ABC transporter substrate-binding protein [Spirillospora albida]|uniref:ABC transporter substrate-binding protein n=1 Tax=Spirillospora albida TaxID=58123 RepID=UPI00068EB260|nr:ABC transporter substrate-binding protein [Spirillospora albida]
MRSLRWLAALTAGLVLTGCAADEPRTAGTRAAAHITVPEQIRAKGTLVVGSDATYAPMEFMQNGELAGFDYELAGALAARLGLKLDFRQTPWAELLDGIAGGRVDAVLSSVTDTAKRQAKVDFVDYLNVGSSIVVTGAVKGDGMAALCGYRLAVAKGTIYVDLAAAQNKRCPAGKKITMVEVDGPSDSRPIVEAGKADAYLDDFPPAALATEQNPGLRLAGPQIEAAPYGIVLAKGSHLTEPIQQALYQVIDDGTYDKLLDKWKITEGALRTGAVNGGA